MYMYIISQGGTGWNSKTFSSLLIVQYPVLIHLNFPVLKALLYLNRIEIYYQPDTGIQHANDEDKQRHDTGPVKFNFIVRVGYFNL